MHEVCKDLSYVAVMIDLLTGSDETLATQEMIDLRNLVAQKSSAVLDAMETLIEGETGGIII